jgi:hypothetical protein
MTFLDVWNYIINKYKQYYFPLTFRPKKEKLILASLNFRLLQCVELMLSSSISDLKNVDYITEIIQKTGLTYDSRGKYLYGHDYKYMLPAITATKKGNQLRGIGGFWQTPQQIAEAIVYLSNFNIKTFIEVGTWQGWTSSIIMAYLSRFNSPLKGLTIDPNNQFKARKLIKNILPLRYKQATSRKLRGNHFDLCFIDGNHKYNYVKQDFENLGKFADICMFHDINHESAHGYLGVKKYWDELKTKNKNDYKFTEFLYHSEGKNVMGIGIAEKIQ